jgi:hypothetical protein
MFDEIPEPWRGLIYLALTYVVYLPIVFFVVRMLERKDSPLAQAFVKFFENLQIGDVVEYAHGYLCMSNGLEFEKKSCWFSTPISLPDSWTKHLSRRERKLVLRKAKEAYTRIFAQKLDGGTFNETTIPVEKPLMGQGTIFNRVILLGLVNPQVGPNVATRLRLRWH